jgi:hypothetical protein
VMVFVNSVNIRFSSTCFSNAAAVKAILRTLPTVSNVLATVCSVVA